VPSDLAADSRGNNRRLEQQPGYNREALKAVRIEPAKCVAAVQNQL